MKLINIKALRSTSALVVAAAIAGSAMLSSCAQKESKTEEMTAEEPVEAVTTEAQNANSVEAISATVINLTDASVLAPGVKVDRLTVVDFNATWCGPCRMLAPVVDELAAQYAGKVDFYSVDVDNFGELFEAWNMGSSIPAILILKPDGTTERYIGTGDLLPISKFQAIINKNL